MSSAAREGPSLAHRVYGWEWPRAFPIVQFPNWPLLVGFAASIVARLSGGVTHDVAFAVATLGYAGWAGWELAAGDNWFRRALGVAGVAWVITRVI